MLRRAAVLDMPRKSKEKKTPRVSRGGRFAVWMEQFVWVEEGAPVRGTVYSSDKLPPAAGEPRKLHYIEENA